MPNYSPGSYDNYERKRLQIARGGMATAMGPMNSLLGRAPSSGAGMSPFAGGVGGRLAGQVGTISPPALPNGMRWGGARRGMPLARPGAALQAGAAQPVALGDLSQIPPHLIPEYLQQENDLLQERALRQKRGIGFGGRSTPASEYGSMRSGVSSALDVRRNQPLLLEHAEGDRWNFGVNDQDNSIARVLNDPSYSPLDDSHGKMNYYGPKQLTSSGVGQPGVPQGHYVPRQVAGQGMPLAPRSSSPPGPGSTFFPGQRMPSIGGMVAGLAPQMDRRMGAGLPIVSTGPSAIAMRIANYFNPQAPQAPQGHNVPRQVGGSPPINWNLGFGRGGNLDVGAPQGSLNSLLPQGQRQPIEPHPAAQYAQGLRQARGTPGQGLMDNYAAQQNYAQAGYMPNMTVGGAWGQKPAALSLGEKLRYGTPAEQAEAGGVVTDRLIANKDGRHFGGAVPVTDSMGRVHFVDPGQPGAASGMSPNQAALAQIAKNPRLGLTASGQGLVGQPEALSPDREAQLAANRAAYQERRGIDLTNRRDNWRAQAQARGQERDARIAARNAPYDPSQAAFNFAVSRNPELAVEAMALRQRGAMADADRALRAQALQVDAAARQDTSNLAWKQASLEADRQRGLLTNDTTRANATAEGERNRSLQLQIENQRLSQRDRQEGMTQAGPLYVAAAEARAAGDEDTAMRLESLGNGLTGAAATPQGPSQAAQGGLQGFSKPTRQRIEDAYQKDPQSVARILKTEKPSITSQEIDGILQELSGVGNASQFRPEGMTTAGNLYQSFTPWGMASDGYNRLTSPHAPTIFGMPVPSLPGPAGYALRHFGY
jgi:hypothetical protein